jgi:hypothetical protein
MKGAVAAVSRGAAALFYMGCGRRQADAEDFGCGHGPPDIHGIFEPVPMLYFVKPIGF